MKLLTRLLAVVVAVGALSPPVIAQTPDCKASSDVDGRLACYDSAPSGGQSAAAKPAALAPARVPAARVPAAKADPGKKADPDKYVDMIGAEDARMNAQLKNICRGC